MQIIKRIFIPLILITILLNFGHNRGGLQSASAQTTATVSVQPRSTSITLGDPLTVDIKVSGGDHLASYDFKLQYDPSILTITAPATNVIDGAFLNPTVNVAYRSVNNTVGIVQFSAYSNAGLNNGASGDGTLATITFQSLIAGTSNLTLSNVLLVKDDLDATLQPNTITNNSVMVATPSNSSPAPSVSPDTTPGPSPTTARVFLKLKLEGVTAPRSEDRLISVRLNQQSPVTIRMHTDSQRFYINNDTDPDRLSNITPGTYDIYIKGPIHLAHLFPGVNLVAGDNSLDFSTTRLSTGDIAPNNVVDEADYTRMIENFGCVVGQPPPEGKNCSPMDADLDFDGDVDIFDYAYMVGNYTFSGD